MLGRFKQGIADALPLQNLGNWRYAPVSDSEGGQQADGKPWSQNLRECVTSKGFWRIALVVAIFLLVANLVRPAKDAWNRYGWTDGPATRPVSEILDEPLPTDGMDWSQYAYCQYVTNEPYLCNSVMIFESLVRLGAKAERLMLYPHQWTVGDGSNAGALLAKARDDYGVRLMPIEVQHLEGEITWADSFTKLLAFNQTAYSRVLSLDSDATVLQPMDELFLLPHTPVAMPRAYWLEPGVLSSQLVLVEPSEFEFNRILEAFNSRGASDYDMEIVNNLYGDSCAIIPHRRYDLLSGEFKGSEHHKYLGSKEEKWDPDKIFNETKFVHFSDWPYPKPWIPASAADREQNQPKCTTDESGVQDCRDQEKWLWLYQDFQDRRARVCGPGFKSKRDEALYIARPASRWEPIFWRTPSNDF